MASCNWHWFLVCVKDSSVSAATLPDLRRESHPVASENSSIWLAIGSESEHDRRMIAISFLFVRLLRDRFKPRWRLEAEILVLRHQLNAPRRVNLRWADRALFIWLYRRCPPVLKAVSILRPETVVRWHRTGFRAYWRWKSRPLGGRPRIGKEVRDLIRRMSLENPVGRSQDPWRIAQSRHRRRPVDSFDLHGAPTGSTIADLEDLPSQSCGRDSVG
jgi:hypothetical protein